MRNILFIFSICLFSFACGSSYKKCNVNSLTKQCTPSNTICVQESPNEKLGYCKCRQNYRFNEHFISDEDYCNLDDAQVSTATAETTPNGLSIEKTEATGYSNDVLAGVLTVIVLLCLTLPAAYIIYKYGVWSWICGKLNNTRSPPLYEDVMIGQEDTDDDPLP